MSTRSASAKPAYVRRLPLSREIALVLLPTATILMALGCVQAFQSQQVLFASLASSAFLIYLNPGQRGASLRALTISQSLAAILGETASAFLGPGMGSAALAMSLLILLLIVLDALHPPAVGTALAFTFRAPSTNLVELFGLVLFVLLILILLQRTSYWLLEKLTLKPVGSLSDEIVHSDL
jgi:CBS-domain-containing membrane protein